MMEQLRYEIELIRADYGYRAGWFVEKDGRQIAILSNAKWEDMFWASFDVSELEPGAIDHICKFDPSLVYRNRRFPEEIAAYGMPAAFHQTDRLKNDGRLHMRGLYMARRVSWLARICAVFVRHKD